MKTFNTWSSACKYIRDYNERNGNQYNAVKKHLSAAVTFAQESFDRTYTTAERTYSFGNGDKYWYPCGGSSLYGFCPSEPGLVRLDWYLNDWKVEYVKITEEEE